MPGMTALIGDFMVIMHADSQLRQLFENSEQDRNKRQLAEQFSAIVDGGCGYTGHEMKALHAAFAIGRVDPFPEQAGGRPGADAPRGHQSLSPQARDLQNRACLSASKAR